ncbi:MAG: OmpA family protein [Pseudomonadota bacterium]
MQRFNSLVAGVTASALLLGAMSGHASDGISAPETADPPPRGKRIADGAGAGGGAVVGGLLGGPFGMMLGAGLGTWLGSRVVQAGRVDEMQVQLDDTERALDRTQQDLDSSRSAMVAMGEDLDARIQDVEHLGTLVAQAELANAQLRGALASGLEMQVMFRTGESELTEDSATQVENLAAVLAEVDGLTVQLDGYADPRGDEQFNEDLTAARVANVEQALRAGGLGAAQLRGFAHGERAYAFEEGDYDAYALERRVDISLTAVEQASAWISTPRATPTPALEEVDLAALDQR